MDKEEAFTKLGLSSNASKEEISSKFKDLALQYHPDKGGDNSKMLELIEARDVALRSFENTLLNVSELKEIIAIVNNSRDNHSLEKKIQQIESHKNLLSKIINDNTRRNKTLKRFSIFMGSASALFFYIPTQLESISEGATNSTIQNSTLFNLNKFSDILLDFYMLKMIFLVSGLFCGYIYIVSSIKVTQIEHLIEDINEMLGNKTEYFNALNKLNNLNKQSFTEDELREIITERVLSQENEPLFRSSLHKDIFFSERKISVENAIKEVGFTYFTCLFISKGLEMGILNENEKIKEGKYLIQYSLAIKEN